MMWNLTDALSIINQIKPVCKKHGYFVCLYGSVLYDGMSNKDLDLQIISYLGRDYSDKLLSEILNELDATDEKGIYAGLLNTKCYIIKLPDGKVIDIVIRTDKIEKTFEKWQ